MTGSDRFENQFSGKDVSAVDREYGPGYWPGGPDLDLATPIQLIPGASVDLGIWKLRKIPLYRVRGSIAPMNCAPEDTVLIRPYRMVAGSATSEGGGTVPCGKDFLLTHYPPGKYWIEASVNRNPRTVSATVPIEVLDSNLELKIAMQRGVDLEGRIVAAEGSSLVGVDRLPLFLAPVIGRGDSNGPSAAVTAGGRFRFMNVPFGLRKVAIWTPGDGFYVSEVRFNGSPVNANIFEWNGSGALEIVIDDRPAVISGSVSDRDKAVSKPDVVLVKWPAYSADVFQSVGHAAGDQEGKFQITGLAPGEYRIFALSPETKDKLNWPHVLERLLQNADKVTLERGGVQSLSLKVSDPLR